MGELKLLAEHFLSFLSYHLWSHLRHSVRSFLEVTAIVLLEIGLMMVLRQHYRPRLSGDTRKPEYLWWSPTAPARRHPSPRRHETNS